MQISNKYEKSIFGAIIYSFQGFSLVIPEKLDMDHHRSTPVKSAVNLYLQKTHLKTQNETHIFIVNLMNTHVYLHLFYMYTICTDHPSELIQTRTELLRNKRIFTELFPSQGAFLY